MSRTVLVVGNPNAGKTALFNALTGASERVGNYPGVTIARRAARGRGFARDVTLVDLPGTYSLSARSPEEAVTIGELSRVVSEASMVLVVVDSTATRRALYFAVQCLELGLPTVVALSLADEAADAGLSLRPERLADALGVPVVAVSARTGLGLDALRAALDAESPPCPPAPPLALAPSIERAVESVAAVIQGPRRAALARARFALLGTRASDPNGLLPAEAWDCAEVALRDLDEAGHDPELEIVSARYALVDAWAGILVGSGSADRSRTQAIDRVLTHPVAGLAVFTLVMGLLFEALFSGSEPLVSLIEAVVAAARESVRAALPAGPLAALLADGVVAGVGNVVVFVPQIALLFLFLTVLEDSGYLARVAFVIDRLMAGVGLHGKAFVPLLSGFACAVPAVLSTRTLEDRRDRLVTMLALPLMSCSARLPVYVLVVATVAPRERVVFGLVSSGAAILFGLYALSVVATLGAAAVLRRTVLDGPRPTLVLELPPYRAPMAIDVARAVWERVRTFLTEAGTTILALTIVLWGLLTYPGSPSAERALAFDRSRIEAAGLPDDAARSALAVAEARAAQRRLETSALGRVGRAIEPALAPLGFDWRIDVGILGAFAAREVFVSTLGIVFGLGEADESSEPLRDSLRRARRRDGSQLFDAPTAASLLVFFVFACQCMSTLAVVRRESGSWRWPLLMLGYMSVLAYAGAFVARHLTAAVLGV